MKKSTVITIILFALCAVLLGTAIALIVVDMNISHEVAAHAQSTQDAILALDESAPDYAAQKAALESTFKTFLDSKTPIQAVLTVASIVVIAGSITCGVLGGKRVAKDIKEKRKAELGEE